MSAYASIKSCRDITEDHLAAAIESRDDTRQLLEHAAKIAAPRTGGARVLLLFARMASSACDWLDGALRVEIVGDADASTVELFAEIGAGLKERIFPAISLRVPIEEFVIAVKKFPKAITPLAFVRPSPKKIVLTAGEAERVDTPSSVPPPKRIKTPPLSAGDLPTIGGASKSAPPPPAAAHLPAVVMSAPKAAGIPKFPTKTEVRIGTAPKFPPPARKKIEPLVVEPKPEPPPVIEPVPALIPVVPQPEKKPELDVPVPSTGAPSQPLARIALKKQVTGMSLPRVVEEIVQGPSRGKRASAAKPAAVPPPPVSAPPPPPDSGPPNEEPAKPQAEDGVDEGWE